MKCERWKRMREGGTKGSMKGDTRVISERHMGSLMKILYLRHIGVAWVNVGQAEKERCEEEGEAAET